MAKAPRTGSHEVVDENDEKSWSLAKRYAALLAPIPPQIAYTVKALRKNYKDMQSGKSYEISESSYDLVRTIDSTNNLRSPLYFAASVLFPKKFKEAEDDTVKALLSILEPGLFSALLCLVYMYRRVGKFSDHQVWENLSEEFLKDMEIGYIVGSAVSSLGGADGVLIGSVRYIALACFMLREPNTLQGYLNLKKGRLDLSYERTKWGCDHAQVAANLLRMIGLTSHPPLDLRDALLGRVRIDRPRNKELQYWADGVAWIDHLKGEPKQPPAITDFELTADEFKSVTIRSELVMSNGSSFKWMKRGYQDPDLAFGKAEAAAKLEEDLVRLNQDQGLADNPDEEIAELDISQEEE